MLAAQQRTERLLRKQTHAPPGPGHRMCGMSAVYLILHWTQGVETQHIMDPGLAEMNFH